MAVLLLLAIMALGIQSLRVNHFKSEFTLLDAKYKIEVAEAKVLVEQAKASSTLKLNQTYSTIASENIQKWQKELMQSELIKKN